MVEKEKENPTKKLLDKLNDIDKNKNIYEKSEKPVKPTSFKEYLKNKK